MAERMTIVVQVGNYLIKIGIINPGEELSERERRGETSYRRLTRQEIADVSCIVFER
jgi:hypothetical protein